MGLAILNRQFGLSLARHLGRNRRNEIGARRQARPERVYRNPRTRADSWDVHCAASQSPQRRRTEEQNIHRYCPVTRFAGDRSETLSLHQTQRLWLISGTGARTLRPSEGVQTTISTDAENSIRTLRVSLAEYLSESAKPARGPCPDGAAVRKIWRINLRCNSGSWLDHAYLRASDLKTKAESERAVTIPKRFTLETSEN